MKLSYDKYFDRVLGCWMGKSLGGIVGAPYECHKRYDSLPLDKLWPSILYPNDDLDIQVVHMEALQELGLEPTSLELARYWQRHCFYVCCEYGTFIDNLEHGIHPPLSGLWENAFHGTSEGCPIRSEIWGIVNAGNPERAREYARRDGCLDHGKASIEMEEYLSAAAALAFAADDLPALLRQTADLMPADNAALPPLNLAFDVSEKLANGLMDEHAAWLELVRHFGYRDSTDAAMNQVIAFLAMLTAGRDFKRMMQICVNFGWDADCTAATAGALYGLVYGAGALPQDWVEKMGKTLVCACEIPHQFASLEQFARESCELGIEMALSGLNPLLEVTGAPKVPVRPLRKAVPGLSVEYQNDQPVLHRLKDTQWSVVVSNPTGQKVEGELKLELPPNLGKSSATRVSLAPGESARIALTVERNDNPLPERNLIHAVFLGGDCHVEEEFGLAAASLWTVYGPYWDMWDKDKYDLCPYEKPDCLCNPGNIPEYAADAMTTHVRFNHPYLDEARLLREELPGERPFLVETASRTLNRRDICAFRGSACYYLVREFRALEPILGANVSVSCDAAYRCWLDGRPAGFRDSHAPTSRGYCGPETLHDLTGKRQRLVIKIASQLDDFSVCVRFTKGHDTRKCAFSPYISSLLWL
ncbi:MAG: ADP-ribosylglycohydrolase family protein [Victivallales bacterium]|nr:ADP-ribosylglycohydrolase family protein [Victivallales bacterium]